MMDGKLTTLINNDHGYDLCDYKLENLKMPTKDIKEIIICAGIVICVCFGMLCILIYGMVWMEGWTKIDRQFASFEERIMKQTDQRTSQSMKDQLMPSAFKGRSYDGNHLKKKH